MWISCWSRGSERWNLPNRIHDLTGSLSAIHLGGAVFGDHFGHVPQRAQGSRCHDRREKPRGTAGPGAPTTRAGRPARVTRSPSRAGSAAPIRRAAPSDSRTPCAASAGNPNGVSMAFGSTAFRNAAQDGHAQRGAEFGGRLGDRGRRTRPPLGAAANNVSAPLRRHDLPPPPTSLKQPLPSRYGAVHRIHVACTPAVRLGAAKLNSAPCDG
jgi:hypothetical protein